MRVGERRPFGRWFARRCGRISRPAACIVDGRWRVRGRPKSGGVRAARVCRRAGGRLAVPRTGFENQQLRIAMRARGIKTAWLAYRKRGGAWRAQGPHPVPLGD